MNFQDLQYLLCIAKHQNLTKAAQELYISQPTLSKFLRKQEQELGGKLFSRSNNCYIPTYLGRCCLGYAKRAVALQQDWEKELLDLHSCSEGELNIAFPLMRSSCMIPRILPVFHKEYPGIHVNLFEETHAIQERLLTDDQLDFAVFTESSPHPKLSYELLLKEEVLLCLPPGHPLASMGHPHPGKKYPSFDLSLMAEEPFILHYPEQNTGQIARDLFKEYQIDPPVALLTRSTQTCALLSQEGLGSCFLPETYVKNMIFRQPPLCFSVGENGIFTTLMIAYRKNAYLASYAKDFIRIAQETVQEED